MTTSIPADPSGTLRDLAAAFDRKAEEHFERGGDYNDGRSDAYTDAAARVRALLEAEAFRD